MQIYRHKKRGTKYELIGIGKIQADEWYERGYVIYPDLQKERPYNKVDMLKVAIYKSVDDGELWVRPLSEFKDGRFELIED